MSNQEIQDIVMNVTFGSFIFGNTSQDDHSDTAFKDVSINFSHSLKL